MSKELVGIVYHFFPHYREPVLKELLKSTNYDYLLVGDKTDPLNSGILEANISDWPGFIYARCHFLWGRFLFQEKVLSFALRKDIKTIIYLGDFQFITTWLSAMLARITGKHVIFWTIGWMKQEYGLKNLVRKSFYHLSHSIIFYGSKAREIAINNGFDPKKMYVVNNSLDYATQKQIREQVSDEELALLKNNLFINPQLPVVIYTGRLTKAKELDILFKATFELYKAGRPINLLIVGDGSERTNLETLANKLGISVHFYGACYDEEVLARLIMLSNLAVLPGLGGLIVMHSLGYGTPIIGRDESDLQSPEWEAVQPGINGDYYRTGDMQDLAMKIEKWVNMQHDNSDLRAKCITVIEKYYTPEYQREIIEKAVRGIPNSL